MFQELCLCSLTVIFVLCYKIIDNLMIRQDRLMIRQDRLEKTVENLQQKLSSDILKLEMVLNDYKLDVIRIETDIVDLMLKVDDSEEKLMEKMDYKIEFQMESYKSESNKSDNVEKYRQKIELDEIKETLENIKNVLKI